MEEVDNILIHNLRQVGCDIPDSIVSLKEFPVELVVQAASTCLMTIDNNLQLPTGLPVSMSSRFRVGATLATACQNLGFQREVGYQTFLYANEHEIRKVIMFLVEKLPKDSAAETMDEPQGKGVQLNRRIAAELKRQFSTPWMPTYCRHKNVCRRADKTLCLQGVSSCHSVKTCHLCYPIGYLTKEKMTQDEKDLFENKLSILTLQPVNRPDLSASIIEENVRLMALNREWEFEWNHSGQQAKVTPEEFKRQKQERILSNMHQCVEVNPQWQGALRTGSGSSAELKDLLKTMSGVDGKKADVKGSRFTHAEKLQFSKEENRVEKEIKQHQELQMDAPVEETEEECQQKREGELEELREQLSQLTIGLQNVKVNMKHAEAQKLQVSEDMGAQEKSNKDLEAAYRVKKRTIDLLPNAEQNLTRLKQVVDNSAQKLVSLNAQWEKHRVPLKVEYEQLKEQNKNRSNEIETKVEQIRVLRIKTKFVADENKAEEETLKQLTEEFNTMSQSIHRSSYTRRILEIVNNIKKQKQGITKVLIDTRNLQKDINFLSGNLDRTFTVIDELIFRDAKKDEFNRNAYKLLATLHEGFSSLVHTVEETGSLMREIRDLEEQADNINTEEMEENLEKISGDLVQVKKENQEMIQKIRASK